MPAAGRFCPACLPEQRSGRQERHLGDRALVLAECSLQVDQVADRERANDHQHETGEEVADRLLRGDTEELRRVVKALWNLLPEDSEARKRGFSRLTVIWEPGEEGPEEFFKRVGFTVVDETQYGEKVGALEL